jgi:hypothetical protein
VELGLVETPIHGLTIYSLQMVYGSNPMQLVIFCEENSLSALESLSIHMLLSFFVANSKAYDSFFPQFVVYAYYYQNYIKMYYE